MRQVIEVGRRVGGRVVSRLRWEVYSARLVARRMVLDISCHRGRQKRLTERLLPYEHDFAARPLKAQRTGDQILRFEVPARVEPASGYVVAGRVGLIEESLHYSEDVRIRSQRQFATTVPTLGQLLRGCESVSVRHAVSAHHPYGQNYFHATTECLGGLALLDEHGRLDGRTVVVGPGLAGTAVFQHAATHGPLAGFDIHVQDERAVTMEHDVLVARVASTGESFRRTERFLTAHLPHDDDADDIKLYLTRPAVLGRTLRNDLALQAALGELGYITINPGELPWAEQVGLFRRASNVVSVHSSALTNVMFRTRAPMNVVEIRVAGRFNTDFERIAVGLGFGFSVVDGRNPSDNGHWAAFDVDIPTVIDSMLELDRHPGLV